MRLRNTLFTAIFAVFVLVLATAHSASAAMDMERFYATGRVVGSANTTLLTGTISPFTVSSVGDGVGRFAGLDFDPVSGILYASSGNGGADAKSLFTLATGTGAATLVGSFGLGTGATLSDLAFGLDGTLYGTDYGQLFTVALGSGLATATSDPFGTANIEGLAVDPTTGTLYGMRWDTGELFTIAPGTGIASSVGTFADIGVGPLALSGLGADSAGVLYVSVGGGNGDIYSLNLNTLTSTLVGDSFAGGASDIAFRVIPEPASIALALLGLTFCTCIRRKR